MLRIEDLDNFLAQNPHLKETNPQWIVSHPEQRSRLPKASQPSELEQRFLENWNMLTNNEPLLREYVFAPDRKFRLDFYHEHSRVGIEVNGGTWTVGGHSTGKGIGRDARKSLLAATYGIHVIAVTSDMLSQKEIVLTLDQIWRVIKSK